MPFAALLAVAILGTSLVQATFATPVLVLLLLIALLAIVRRPVTGVFIILFSASIVYFAKRLTYATTGILSEFGNPVTIVFNVIMVFLFGVSLSLMHRRLLKTFYVGPSEILLFCIVATYGISGIFSPSAEAFIYGFKATVFPLLMIAVGKYVVTIETYRQVLVAKIIVAFLVLGYGIKQGIVGFFGFEYEWAAKYAGINNLAWFLNSSDGKILRVFSTLSDPFDFAAESMLMLVLAVVLLLEDSRKSLSALLIAVSIIALYYTGIRGAWVGAIAGIFVAVGSFAYKRKLFIGFALIGVTVIALAIGIVETIETSNPMAERVRSLADPFSVHQMHSRYENWVLAVESAITNPMGTGLGSSGFIGRTFGAEAETAIIPDSLYVQALIETGWIGAALFGVLIVYVAGVNVIRYVKYQVSRERSVFLLAASSVVAIAVHGFTTPIQEANAIIWCWLLLGIADMVSISKRNEERHDRVA